MEKIEKIVELGIDIDNENEELFEDLGVDVISFVESPAIEESFLYFNTDGEPTCDCGTPHEFSLVDNTGFEKIKAFLFDNQDLFKSTSGPAGDGGVDHTEQKRLLEAAGISTEFPFGYCFPVSQFVFYALGGYEGEYDLKCIKGMEYQVQGQDFKSTHWFVEHKETGRIIDLTAEQFDGILDLEDYYEDARRANLGFPYYNVGDKRVEFDNTVPSFEVLGLYDKYREDVEVIEGLEAFYIASQYAELRKKFGAMFYKEEEYEFIYPTPSESKGDFISRCIPTAVNAWGVGQDQAAALCYAYWDSGKKMAKDNEDTKKKKEKKSYNETLEAVLKFAEENGETMSHDDVFVDLTKEEFTTAGDVIRGLGALDLLTRLNIKRDEPSQTYYRYVGPPAQRKFCKAMLRLANRGKIFTEDQINEMNGLNPQFARSGESSYSVFEWLGGKNCRHRFQKLEVFKNAEGKRVVILADPTNEAQRNAARPWAQKVNMSKEYEFKLDEERREVYGPVMIPNKMILRRDEEGNPFYVFFSRETIKKMAEKFLAQNKQHNTDIEHDGNVVTKNTLLESWVSEDMTHDKSYKLGFALPAGTWYAGFKVNDDQLWEEIKAGARRGFSLAGNFINRL